MDPVVGFVHVKDILIANLQNPNFSIREVMRPVFTIHEAMRLDLLLRKNTLAELNLDLSSPTVGHQSI